MGETMNELASALIGAFVALAGILLAGALESRRNAARLRSEWDERLRGERKSAAIAFVNDVEVAAHRIRDHAKGSAEGLRVSLHDATDAVRRAQIEVELVGSAVARDLASQLYAAVRHLRTVADGGNGPGTPEWERAHDAYKSSRDAFTARLRDELGRETA